MHPGPGKTALLPSPGNYPGNGFWWANFLPHRYCLTPALSKMKTFAPQQRREKQGRGGKRGLFAVVFCLESGWSRGPSAAAPPNSHRKEEIILHRDKRYRRQKQQFGERIAWPPDDVRLLEATARLKSSRDAVFMKRDSASSSPKDNFIWRSALLSRKTKTGWKFPSCQPHAGSPRLRLPLREGCAPPRSELLRSWLAPSEMKSPRFVGTRWKLRELYRHSSSARLSLCFYRDYC